MTTLPDSYESATNEYLVKTNDRECRIKATKMYIDTENNRLVFWREKLIIAVFAMDVVEYFQMI